jgi:hypothetical protein
MDPGTGFCNCFDIVPRLMKKPLGEIFPFIDLLTFTAEKGGKGLTQSSLRNLCIVTSLRYSGIIFFNISA